ncbi:MAG: DUF2752 domain-containing protein [Chloroflexi bacterium]|nr:MAG: DUF2752 domain-containing protein [Chloroflexota bacterium]
MSTMPIAFNRATQADRMRDLGIFFVLIGWLAYTRIYWILQAAHLGAPPCPFYYLTGHPCPFCGGTRSFAYMWQGDLSDAVRLYPLGPALFVGTVLGAGGLAAGLLSGRTFVPRLSSMQWRLLWVGAVSALLLSWALKVFVLGN